MVTKYIAGDGTGDYNCDGVDDDVQINSAFLFADANPGTILYFKGPFKYVISLGILVGSHLTVTGDSTVCVSLKANAGWATGIPLFGNRNSSILNVEFYGFEIDGNDANQTEARGSGFYMNIYFTNQTNCTVHDMYIHDSLADGFRTNGGVNARFYNNTCKRLGHEACYFEATVGGEIFNNYTEIRTNSAHRLRDSSNITIHDNIMKPYALTSISGNPGIEIEDSTGNTSNIEIYDNTITDCWGEGIWIIEYGAGNSNRAKNLYVHDNTIKNCGRITTINYNAGITIQGFNGARIENNIIDGCYNAGVLCVNSPLAASTIFLTNNTVKNTRKTLSSSYASSNAAWTGDGIVNLQPSSYTMVLTGNSVTDSAGLDNYFNVDYANDKIDTSDTHYNPPAPYAPPDTGYDYYVAGRTAYINGYPFNWTDKKIDVAKTMGQLKSPGVDGWSLEDFGFGGADITLDCYADSFVDIRQAIAAFYEDGRSVLELGGIYAGYQITGYASDHSTNLRLSDQTYEYNYPYSIGFTADKPIMEKVVPRVRGRRVSSDNEEWSSDNIFTGNLVSNFDFESWTNVKIGMSWQSQETPSSDENEWRAICWSPELGIFAATAISGTGSRVMTSPDGINWFAQTTPADNNWVACIWVSALGMFVSTAVTGAGNRVMTSYNGVNWTIRSTNNIDFLWTGLAWSPALHLLVAVSYGGAGDTPVMTSPDGLSWTPRTLSNTNRTQQWTSVCWSASLGIFIAVSENGTTSQIMGSADGINWYTQTTPYATGRGFRSIVWAQELGLFVAVANTGTQDRAMYSTDGLTWTPAVTPVSDNNLYGIAWSTLLMMFAVVANSGTANRVITSVDFGSLQTHNIAPDNWTLVTQGQEMTVDFAYSGTRSYLINGNGIDNNIGQIVQKVFIEPGVYYALSARGKVVGLTQGQLEVDIFSGNMIVASLLFTEDTDWTLKTAYLHFDTIPSDAKVRVLGTGTVNNGALLYIDYITLQKVTDSGEFTIGNDILTEGTINCVPEVTVSAAPLIGGVPVGGVINQFDQNVWSAVSTIYLLQNTYTLPGKLWKKYRLDLVQFLMKATAGAGAYVKVTAQATSFYSGIETTLLERYTTSSDYVYQGLPLMLLCATNDTLVIRLYIHTTVAGARIYVEHFNFDYAELGSIVAVTNVKIYNKADPLNVLWAANNLFPGATMAIRADQTGYFKYLEDFDDTTYTSSIYESSGTVTYSSANKTLTLGSNAYITYGFDCRYPITGIPFIYLFINAGSPFIYIAEDNGGVPGTFIAVDGNSDTDVTNEWVARNLDSVTTLRLKGNTVWYVRIKSPSGQTVIMNKLFIYSDLLTVDAEQLKVFATGAANTFVVEMDNSAPLDITLSFRDAHMVI